MNSEILERFPDSIFQNDSKVKICMINNDRWLVIQKKPENNNILWSKVPLI